MWSVVERLYDLIQFELKIFIDSCYIHKRIYQLESERYSAFVYVSNSLSLLQ